MRTSLRITNVLEDFIALFYPNYCDACHGDLVKGEEILCSGCLLDLPKTNYHQEKHNPLYKRLYGRITIDSAIAYLLFRRNSKVQSLLHALKYKNRPDIGRKLGLVYGQELCRMNYHYEADAIVPIPLHAIRQRVRGYNQSEEFAIGLSTALGIPVDIDLVKKVVKTETQTKRTKLDRWENVQEVFQVDDKSVKQKRILLVDDIITTGATIEACGQQLLAAGCGRLSIACIAATQ
jgi:ComF family protein